MPEFIKCFAGEEVEGTQAAEHTPPGTVRGKHDVLVVVGDVLGAGVGWSVREVGV